MRPIGEGEESGGTRVSFVPLAKERRRRYDKTCPGGDKVSQAPTLRNRGKGARARSPRSLLQILSREGIMLKVSRSVETAVRSLFSLQERKPGFGARLARKRARFTGMSACSQHGSVCPRSSISRGSNASPADHSRDG